VRHKKIVYNNFLPRISHEELDDIVIVPEITYPWFNSSKRGIVKMNLDHSLDTFKPFDNTSLDTVKAYDRLRSPSTEHVKIGVL
jgi:hypothetical protein